MLRHDFKFYDLIKKNMVKKLSSRVFYVCVHMYVHIHTCTCAHMWPHMYVPVPCRNYMSCTGISMSCMGLNFMQNLITYYFFFYCFFVLPATKKTRPKTVAFFFDIIIKNGAPHATSLRST